LHISIKNCIFAVEIQYIVTMTSTISTNNRQDLALLFRTLSKEDAVWSVKYLIDYMYTIIPNSPDNQPLPSWWNRPLSAKTKAMRLSPTQEMNSDYKAELESILTEKYA